MPITIEDEIAVCQDDLVDMRGNASRSPIHLGDGDVAAIRRLAGIRRRPGGGHKHNKCYKPVHDQGSPISVSGFNSSWLNKFDRSRADWAATDMARV
ncbi:hypothetical protein FBZ98_11740 [Rhizobium sp. ERR 922]|nr:hypothetical protein FBZ98_11740 [Rhizobium sp. ERR 922]TWB87871.1 hypothetical protein FBZ97_11640 [Rhizobium sp. ERR 942]